MTHDLISSRAELEKAALDYGLLPFFANGITGFSVEEMAAPGMLFSDTPDGYGCWEWKGPVIREQTTAYGKFFRRKAGFVSRSLLPDFLNYRRHAYPVAPGSHEAMILDTVRRMEGITSTELKKLIPGRLESPLQRLQMGGWLLIADFEYKYTAAGRRYGWGIALYSTPEVWFDHHAIAASTLTPDESLQKLIDHLTPLLPEASRAQIHRLLA